MKTLSDHFSPIIFQQREFLKQGITAVYCLFDFQTVFGSEFHRNKYYQMNPSSLIQEGSLFQKSVELLDSLPDGEYRVYNYIFNFDEKAMDFKFQHICYFFIKRKNDRAYIMNDVSFITEASFNRLLIETRKQGIEKILFQRMD